MQTERFVSSKFSPQVHKVSYLNNNFLYQEGDPNVLEIPAKRTKEWAQASQESIKISQSKLIYKIS